MQGAEGQRKILDRRRTRALQVIKAASWTVGLDLLHEWMSDTWLDPFLKPLKTESTALLFAQLLVLDFLFLRSVFLAFFNGTSYPE